MTANRNTTEPSRLISRSVGPEERPVTVLIEAAMDVGIDVIDRTELNDIIDPDALNLLFGPRLNGEPRYGGSTVFEAWGLLFHVTPGRVDLYPDDVSEAAVLREAVAENTVTATGVESTAPPRPELNDD